MAISISCADLHSSVMNMNTHTPGRHYKFWINVQIPWDLSHNHIDKRYVLHHILQLNWIELNSIQLEPIASDAILCASKSLTNVHDGLHKRYCKWKIPMNNIFIQDDNNSNSSINSNSISIRIINCIVWSRQQTTVLRLWIACLLVWYRLHTQMNM